VTAASAAAIQTVNVSHKGSIIGETRKKKFKNPRDPRPVL
jgi:hypothetical protein